MRMIMIVFRDSLEQDVMKVLKDLGVKAFTEMPSVVGTGNAGPAFHSLVVPQTNAMVLTALEDDQADQVIAGLRTYREELTKRQHGAYIPLRVFALPCEHVV